MAVGDGPAPFSNIGRRAKDLLNKGYNYNHKFLLFLQSSTGLGLKATGFNKGQIFVGDISTEYRTRFSTVNVQVDTYSNISTKIVIADVLPSVKVAISFGTDQKSGKFSTKIMIASVLPYANAAISFDIPDHKSGKLDVHYFHHHAAINSSIGLTPSPQLEFAAVVGNKSLAFGGEVGFHTGTSSFSKYNAGITFNRRDFTAALMLYVSTSLAIQLEGQRTNIGGILFPVRNPSSSTKFAAEVSSTCKNDFCFGIAHKINPSTTVKTRFSNNGKVAMLCQQEWRPKSFITFATELEMKAVKAKTPKFGIVLVLKS